MPSSPPLEAPPMSSFSPNVDARPPRTMSSMIGQRTMPRARQQPLRRCACWARRAPPFRRRRESIMLLALRFCQEEACWMMLRYAHFQAPRILTSAHRPCRRAKEGYAAARLVQPPLPHYAAAPPPPALISAIGTTGEKIAFNNRRPAETRRDIRPDRCRPGQRNAYHAASGLLFKFSFGIFTGRYSVIEYGTRAPMPRDVCAEKRGRH